MKNFLIFLLLGLSFFLTNCEAPKTTELAQSQKGMIKVSILYPNEEGKSFDMDYYASKHMPMLEELFGDSLKKLEIDLGKAGRTPEEPIPFLAVGYLYFESLEAYQAAFGPHADKIRGDIPNYTNIQPIVQISEVIQ
ncbi:MAG: EthD family reductase [Bacteroidota bacterium]